MHMDKAAPHRGCAWARVHHGFLRFHNWCRGVKLGLKLGLQNLLDQ